MRCLSNSEYRALRKALTGPAGIQIQFAIFKLALDEGQAIEKVILNKLIQLGLLEDGKFTDLGQLVKDPLREYGFWLQRDRQLPSENCTPVIKRRRFANKNVLELGSGGGCNLLSLTGLPAKLVGLEPMPLYCQMTPILAEMAGIEPPLVIEAFAESIPLEDNSFDIIICYTSHQYMSINPAISEISRVLKPGGELIIIGNTLYSFAWEALGLALAERNLAKAKNNFITIANTVFYQIAGHRFIRDSKTTTATPVYPSHRYMRKRLKKEGLIWNQALSCIVESGETVLVANK